MNKIFRVITLFAPLLVAPAALLAQSPFDGTWRINYDLSKAPEKPTVYSLNHGMYSCSTCTPKVEVKADGTDQPVAGQALDTISVRVVDAKTVIRTNKKDGTVITEYTYKLSDDGKTLMYTVAFPANSDPKTATYLTLARVDPAPSGAHALSGSWKFVTGKTTGNAGLVTIKTTADGLSCSSFSGAAYTAKFDGKDYPVTGGGLWTSVSFKRVDAHTIVETDKRGGKVSAISTNSISSDGAKMSIANLNKLNGDRSTAVYEKQ